MEFIKKNLWTQLISWCLMVKNDAKLTDSRRGWGIFHHFPTCNPEIQAKFHGLMLKWNEIKKLVLYNPKTTYKPQSSPFFPLLTKKCYLSTRRVAPWHHVHRPFAYRLRHLDPWCRHHRAPAIDGNSQDCGGLGYHKKMKFWNDWEVYLHRKY